MAPWVAGLLSEYLDRRVQARYGGPVAGVDEAGRGPLAGPLLVAAVVLPSPWPLAAQLADSKMLSFARREELAQRIRREALAYALWRVPPWRIDAEGVTACVLRGMARAVEALSLRPAAVLVDGPMAPSLSGIVHLPVVDGDRLSASIMAASILAKVARDREMGRWDRRDPRYGFGQHKGYGTASHREALLRWGPSPIHRRRFLHLSETDDGGCDPPDTPST